MMFLIGPPDNTSTNSLYLWLTATVGLTALGSLPPAGPMEKGEPTVPSSRPSRAGRPPSRPRSREEREEWDAAHEDEIAIENEKVDRILERRGRAAERAEKRLPEKIAREWTLTKTEAAIFFALVKVVLKPFGRVY